MFGRPSLRSRVRIIEKEQILTRQAITSLQSTVADVRRDYDAKLALISQSASDAQARINDAVSKAIAAKEEEDDEAFGQATADLKDIMNGHVQTVTDNVPAPAPASDAGTGQALPSAADAAGTGAASGADADAQAGDQSASQG